LYDHFNCCDKGETHLPQVTGNKVVWSASCHGRESNSQILMLIGTNCMDVRKVLPFDRGHEGPRVK